MKMEDKMAMLSKKLSNAIKQMVDELNVDLPEDSEPQTAEGWIDNTLKAPLADYFAEKTRAGKEEELSAAKKIAQDKEWEVQNLVVAKRKEVFEL